MLPSGDYLILRRKAFRFKAFVTSSNLFSWFSKVTAKIEAANINKRKAEILLVCEEELKAVDETSLKAGDEIHRFYSKLSGRPYNQHTKAR